MLAPERLADLQFQALHNGHTRGTVERLSKRGVDAATEPHGTMISVTPKEMSVLLAAYAKGNGDETDTA